MRRRGASKWRVLFGLGVLIAALLAMPHVAPAVDVELDGFNDAYESGNNTFVFAGPVNSPTVTAKWSKCPAQRVNDDCVDPAKKDLFVFFANPSSAIPATNRLSIFNKIGIILAHDIPANYVTSKREVAKEGATIARQKAVQVVDNTTGGFSEILGITTGGTPNTTSPVTIYTQRIINFLDSACSGRVCVDDSTSYIYGQGANFRDQFVRHVLAHELGHTVTRVSPLDTVVGPHYPAENKVIMSQYVYKEYPSGTGGIDVKFFIPTVWTDNDKSGARVK